MENEMEAALQTIKFFNTILDASVDGVVITDLNKNIIIANDAFSCMFGKKRSEVVRTNLFIYLKQFDGDALEDWINLQEHTCDHGSCKDVRFQITKCGRTRYFNVNASLIVPVAPKYGDSIITIWHDITETRQEAIDELQRSEARYKSMHAMFRLMADNMPDLLWAKDMERRFLFVNQAMCDKLLLADDTDEPIGKDDMFFVKRARQMHPYDPQWHTFGEMGVDSDKIVMSTRKPRRFDEYGNVQGEFLYLDVYKAPIWDEKGKIVGTVGCGRVVTREKEIEQKLRKSEEKFRTLTALSPVGMFINDSQGNIIYINEKCSELIGMEAEKALGSGWMMAVHPDDREKVDGEWKRAVERGDGFHREWRWVHKDGRIVWTQGDVVPVRVVNDKVNVFIGTLTDITMRKQAENKIKASLKEKEVLLREIHHRVKNNMQVIISLLRMHSRRIDDERLQQVFGDCQDRIFVMSLIHETLYQSGDFSRIDFGVYLKKLCHNLGRVYATPRKGIAVEVRHCTIMMDMDKSIAVGMVISELVSNAFKYAFPFGKANGKVSISLTGSNGDAVLLIVEDNGVGLPKEIDIHNSPSLGLKLVAATVKRELMGTIEVERNGGTRFIIKFQCKSL